jgi:hypothetical protein
MWLPALELPLPVADAERVALDEIASTPAVALLLARASAVQPTFRSAATTSPTSSKSAVGWTMPSHWSSPQRSSRCSRRRRFANAWATLQRACQRQRGARTAAER